MAFKHAIKHVVSDPAVFFLVFAVVVQLLYYSCAAPLKHYPHGPARFFHIVHLANTMYGKPNELPANILKLKTLAASKRPFKETLNLKLNPDHTVPFKSAQRAAHYSIVGYAPFVLGAFIGLGLNLSPLAIFYLSIGCNALFSIALGYYTLRILPVLRWPFCFLLLLPSTFLYRTYVMPDALTMELCFLAVAIVLNLKNAPHLLSGIKKAGLIFLAILIGVVKIAYFFVPLIYFLIPKPCFASPRSKFRFIVIAVIAGIVAAMAWNMYITAEFSPYAKLLPRKIGYVLHYPLVLLSTVYDFTLVYWSRFLNNMVFWQGKFPHLNILLALPFMAAAMESSPNLVSLRVKERTVALGVFMLSWGAIIIAMWMHINLSPRTIMQAAATLQGRYFLPLLPCLLLLVYSTISVPGKLKPYVGRLTAFSVIASVAYLNYTRLLAMAKRGYYVLF